jgi:NADPH:quinone reductase-like Zn-dependent oxidoreductase
MSVPIFPSPGSLEADSMRAAVYTRFGPPEVIAVRTLVRPVPKADQIRIRILATTVTSACTLMRRGDTLMARLVLGLFGPRKRFQVAGIEFAGTVEQVGRSVREWRPGDRVFGFAGFDSGTYAQYHCLSASASLAKMPESLDFGEAASLVDGPTTALFFLERLARVRRGERVLIIGASGSVGGAAVQVAKSLGAQVTGVCSTANLELVRSLGADRVIDYTQEDFTQAGERYDVIFDAVTKSTFSACKPCLSKGGRYLPTVPRLGDYLLMVWTRFFGDRRILCGMSIEKREALGVVKELLARGALRPVIDRRYPLDQIALAHGYVDTGRKKGNVVIDMA